MEETNQRLRSTITHFIHDLHETNGDSISHVTVTVHGELKHFEPDRRINSFSVTKMKGVTRLSYQEMELDAPIANMVTVIATEKLDPPA